MAVDHLLDHLLPEILMFFFISKVVNFMSITPCCLYPTAPNGYFPCGESKSYLAAIAYSALQNQKWKYYL